MAVFASPSSQDQDELGVGQELMVSDVAIGCVGSVGGGGSSRLLRPDPRGCGGRSWRIRSTCDSGANHRAGQATINHNYSKVRTRS